jgi:ribosomal protein S18 acetylase RimI-like enzyme
MKIHRLKTGDEEAAIEAIRDLKPSEERSGQNASIEHMKLLLTSEENYLYIAYVNTVPVGFLLAYSFPRIDRDQNMIYLYEIDVIPKYRRQGIGSQMIQRLKNECRCNNVMKVWVGTENDNIAARALYESTGAKCQGKNCIEFVYDDFKNTEQIVSPDARTSRR